MILKKDDRDQKTLSWITNNKLFILVNFINSPGVAGPGLFYKHL